MRITNIAAVATAAALTVIAGCDKAKVEGAATSASAAGAPGAASAKKTGVFDAKRAEELRKQLRADPRDSAGLAEWAAMGKPVAKDIMYHVLEVAHSASEAKDPKLTNAAVAATSAVAGLGAIDELKKIAKEAEQDEVKAAACVHLVKAGESCP